MLRADVRRHVDAIWDRIWASGVSNPLTAIEYFSTVLLLRRLADAEAGRATEDAALWKTLIGYIDAGDAQAVSRLMREVQTKFGIGASPEIASASTWRDLSTLREVLSGTLALELSDRHHDILGDVFEYMLNHLSTAGHFGQFRTPRHLIKFMVEAVAPREGEVVVDPACGTAGFLIAAHEFRGAAPGQPYIGSEVDATMARVARTNVLLHRMDDAAISHGDGLQVERRDADVILANPPFAGAVAVERSRGFESGTRKTELLFVELMMRRLRDGGRAATVVPTGVLTSHSGAALWVRRRLVEANRLRAVVELPGGVFRPYTGVKTALLFWSNERSGVDVLMVRVANDGYSLDDRREQLERSDLPDALRLLNGGKSELPHARVPPSTLAAAKYNLSPSRYITDDPNDDFGLADVSLAATIQSARAAAGAVAHELERVKGLLR